MFEYNFIITLIKNNIEKGHSKTDQKDITNMYCHAARDQPFKYPTIYIPE